MSEFWSIKDVAAYLDVEYKTVYRLVRKGEIPAAKVGGVYRIRKGDVDAYIERQQVRVLASEASTPSDDVKCTACRRLLTDSSQIGGLCSAEGCDHPICTSCWERDGIRYCDQHRPLRRDQLTDARARLAAGEIPLLVTALEARQRELGFISRFDHKVRRIAKLRHPLYNRVLQPSTSWLEQHVAMDDSRRLMQLLQTGYLSEEAERGLPVNPLSRYVLPESGSNEPGLIIEAQVRSHLPVMVRQGFDTRPATMAELLQVLERSIELAESRDVACLVGIAATTGWTPDAEAYIEGASEGRSFFHEQVLPCLIDLHDMQMIYRAEDQRIVPLVSLFEPYLPEEKVSQVVDYVKRELLTSHGVSVEEVTAAMEIDRKRVREAFDRLLDQGGYRLEEIPSVGTVIRRAEE